MRQQSRWARRLMKCPEGRGKSALFVEWRLEKDGEVAAFILVLSRTAQEEYIESFGVHPSYRGRGLAKYLMMKVIEVMQNDGAENLTLGVDSVNRPAIGLYEQVGFRTVSRTIRYSWVRH